MEWSYEQYYPQTSSTVAVAYELCARIYYQRSNDRDVDGVETAHKASNLKSRQL